MRTVLIYLLIVFTYSGFSQKKHINLTLFKADSLQEEGECELANTYYGQYLKKCKDEILISLIKYNQDNCDNESDFPEEIIENKASIMEHADHLFEKKMYYEAYYIYATLFQHCPLEETLDYYYNYYKDYIGFYLNKKQTSHINLIDRLTMESIKNEHVSILYGKELLLLMSDSTGSVDYEYETFKDKKVKIIVQDYYNDKVYLNDTITLKLYPLDKPFQLENVFYRLSPYGFYNPESEPTFKQIVTIMEENPSIVVEISSHTDFRPIPMGNDSLSQKRSERIIQYLIEMGIDEERLVPKGYGAKRPWIVTKENTVQYPFLIEGTELTKEYILTLESIDQREVCHQLNRRTEMLFIGYTKEYEQFFNKKNEDWEEYENLDEIKE